MLKVLLHCMACQGSDDSMYGRGGLVHKELEKLLGEQINYTGVGGYLKGREAQEFISIASDADIVLLDAWTHPEGSNWMQRNSGFDPYEDMASIANELRRTTKAKVFAQLMGGVSEVAVHLAGATPYNYHTNREILSALIAASKAKSG